MSGLAPDAERRLACRECAAPITHRAVTGRCNPCARRVNMRDPEQQARRLAGLRRKMASDPEYRARKAAVARAARSSPEQRRLAREQALANRPWQHAATKPITPERSARIARGQTERWLSWCPPELRDEYRWLRKSKKMGRDEARQIVLAKHRLDQARFRRSLGEDVPGDELPTGERADVPGIIDAALALSGVSRAELLSPSRLGKLVHVRQAICLVAMERGFSSAEVGRCINRDHTVILYSRDAAGERERDDVEYARFVRSLRTVTL